jgi:hypothetical protein
MPGMGEKNEGRLHLVDCKSAATRCPDWDDLCHRMRAPSTSRALASGKRGVR